MLPVQAVLGWPNSSSASCRVTPLSHAGLTHAGMSPQQKQTPLSVSPGHSTGLPVMQLLPSTFSRSPAGGPSVSGSAPDSAPQGWLGQPEALSSLHLKGPASVARPQARELFRVDLQAASSSPLAPQTHPVRGSAAQPDMTRADFYLTRAVSARPFSIQHSFDVQKAAHPQGDALPWLEVTEAGAALNAEADAVNDRDSPPGHESKAGRMQASGVGVVQNPFAGQAQPSSPEAWAFQASGQQGKSLLDM